jgi:hypothetical protein
MARPLELLSDYRFDTTKDAISESQPLAVQSMHLDNKPVPKSLVRACCMRQPFRLSVSLT